MGVDRVVDITAKQRKTVTALLERHLPGTAVWIYGSRAKWTARPQSDLDLVVFATPEQNGRIGALREAFEESDLPFRVDLFVWDEVPDEFRRQIQAEHVVLLAARNGEPSDDGKESGGADEWATTTIKEIADKVAMGPFGSSIKVDTFVSEGVPIISGQHLHGFRVDDEPGFNFISPGHAQQLANANVQHGDIVFTHAGNIGQVSYIPADSKFERYVISQRQFYMRCDRSKAVPEFVTMYFRSPEGQHQLLANTSQVGVPSIAQPVTYLRTIQLRLPSLPEQRAIAHILGTLDDKIKLNRRMTKTVEALARALFTSWFVKFDPVRAKMADRDSGLPKHIAALFPDRFVESEMGEIPEGWKVGTLEDVASLNPESWSTRNAPDEIVYVDLSNTKWGCIEKLETYPWKAAPSRGRRVLRRGDTIVGTVRPGNGSFSLVGRDGLTGSTGFAVLRPKTPSDAELIWCAATSQDNIDRLTHLADGGAYPAVRPEVIAATKLPLADFATRAAFSSVAASLLNQANAIRQQSQTLAALRDTLLPKLISGKMRVNDAEAILDRAP